MKCPFCGHESRNQVCDKCFAVIPAEKPKEDSKDDTKRYRNKNKDKE